MKMIRSSSSKVLLRGHRSGSMRGDVGFDFIGGCMYRTRGCHALLSANSGVEASELRELLRLLLVPSHVREESPMIAPDYLRLLSLPATSTPSHRLPVD